MLEETLKSHLVQSPAISRDVFNIPRSVCWEPHPSWPWMFPGMGTHHLSGCQCFTALTIKKFFLLFNISWYEFKTITPSLLPSWALAAQCKRDLNELCFYSWFGALSPAPAAAIRLVYPKYLMALTGGDLVARSSSGTGTISRNQLTWTLNLAVVWPENFP